MNIPTNYEPYSGRIFNRPLDDIERSSIFVSIVSYRDESIVNTISSLLDNAKRPNNIFISVAVTEFFSSYVHQWIKPLKDMEENIRNLKIKIIDLKNETTFGELKSIADSQYNKENYYMSISSRSEFCPNWDDILITQYNNLRSNLDGDFIITAEPRLYLPHDNVVDGFSYFTNHKTKKSMQREDYDGARVPISGYSHFVNNNNIMFSRSQEAAEDHSTHDHISQIDKVMESEEFLQINNFVKFNSRKFVKDEYVAIASGFYTDFCFSYGDVYIKNNRSDATLIDKDQFNFYSFINFVHKNIPLISFRFIPTYIMYDDNSEFIQQEKSPRDLISESEYKESQGAELIQRNIHNNVYNNKKFDELLAVDWKEKKFKVRDSIISNTVIDGINFFISMYNFSTYENTLSWNKRC